MRNLPSSSSSSSSFSSILVVVLGACSVRGALLGRSMDSSVELGTDSCAPVALAEPSRARFLSRPCASPCAFEKVIRSLIIVPSAFLYIRSGRNNASSPCSATIVALDRVRAYSRTCCERGFYIPMVFRKIQIHLAPSVLHSHSVSRGTR